MFAQLTMQKRSARKSVPYKKEESLPSTKHVERVCQRTRRHRPRQRGETVLKNA